MEARQGGQALSAAYAALAVATIMVGARIASRLAGGFDVLAREPPGSADLVMAVATVVATLFLVLVFVPQHRPHLARVLPRLGAGLVANVLAAAVVWLAFMGALLLVALGGILGTIAAVLGILWMASRLVLVPATAMLGGKGPAGAIGLSWRMTRGVSVFIALGLVLVVVLAMAAGAFLRQFDDALALVGSALMVAAGEAAIAAATWRAAGDFIPRPPPRNAPERLVGPQSDVPDAARLVPLRNRADLDLIRSLPEGTAIWAQLETGDQELMAGAVQAGVQVFVADDRHRALLGLQNTGGPRLADLTDAGISWCGSLYVAGTDGWTRVLPTR